MTDPYVIPEGTPTTDALGHIGSALMKETPKEDKLTRRDIERRRVPYRSLSSLLAEIGMATEQEEADELISKMRMAD